tara:strand:+ start:216 stop:1484 length:1269 start_codon:yes stop_codon:yes gene_type:complete
MNQIRSIKGTHDILPRESIKWRNLEKNIHHICAKFGHQEIRTPIFEETGLFARSVGENTDIVSKEMYTWEDKKNKYLTLRPELTASVARSFIQHNMGNKSPIQRLYYIGPLFRRERPQKGRQRQFHQFGVEAFGSEYPEQDVEIISIAWHILLKCGLNKNIKLHINSIGSSDCRMAYRVALQKFLRPNLKMFSKNSQRRFETNPLRILDTKNENERLLLKEAPKISSYYSDEDSKHFELITKFLNEMDIPFTIDANLVRGLDYYTRTVFEFTSDSLGAQNALIGGGRYDGLIETLGGKNTPGMGFAAGMERLLLAMASNTDEKTITFKPDVYFIYQNVNYLSLVMQLSNQLRKNGHKVIFDSVRRSMKAQLRDANRSGARYALILGEHEIENSTISFKDLASSDQKTIPQLDLINFFDNLTN